MRTHKLSAGVLPAPFFARAVGNRQPFCLPEALGQEPINPGKVGTGFSAKDSCSNERSCVDRNTGLWNRPIVAHQPWHGRHRRSLESSAVLQAHFGSVKIGHAGALLACFGLGPWASLRKDVSCIRANPSAPNWTASSRRSVSRPCRRGNAYPRANPWQPTQSDAACFGSAACANGHGFVSEARRGKALLRLCRCGSRRS